MRFNALSLKPRAQNLGPWAFPCALLIISALIAACGDEGRRALRYQSTLIQDAHYWRLLSAHITHLGWSHLALNFAGLAAIWALYRKTYSLIVWAGIFGLCSLWISIGFLLFNPELGSYVGLSGALHGLLASCLATSIGVNFSSIFSSTSTKFTPLKSIAWEDILLLIGLWAKIVYEQSVGPVPLTQSASGGPVIIDAHLYGVVIGTIIGLGAGVYKQTPKS